MLDKLNRDFEKAVARLQETDLKLSGVSVGYAYYDKNKTNIQAVIEEADEMMYRNKNKNILN